MKKAINENLPQAALYHLGEKQLGDQASDASSVEVRRAGVRRIARTTAAGAAALTLAVGLVEGGKWAIDHSPTTVYQQHLQEQEQNQPSQQQINEATQAIGQQAPVAEESQH